MLDRLGEIFDFGTVIYNMPASDMLKFIRIANNAMFIRNRDEQKKNEIIAPESVMWEKTACALIQN